MTPARVLIAAEHSLVRAGLRALLSREPDIAIVAEAGDDDATEAELLRTRADVVLVDAAPLSCRHADLTRRLLGHATDVKVVLLTPNAADDDVLDAFAAGAAGIVCKTDDSDELLRTVKAVAGGRPVLSPALARSLISSAGRVSHRPRAAAPLTALTGREREVVALVAQGLTNDEIADRLVISHATAKTHVSRAMVKLGSRDRAQLVVFAYDTGLVVPPATS